MQRHIAIHRHPAPGGARCPPSWGRCFRAYSKLSPCLPASPVLPIITQYMACARCWAKGQTTELHSAVKGTSQGVLFELFLPQNWARCLPCQQKWHTGAPRAVQHRALTSLKRSAVIHFETSTTSLTSLSNHLLRVYGPDNEIEEVRY